MIIPVLVSIWNITSGFMIPRDDIPNFWIWVYWLNPTQYALQALLSIAFFCDTSAGAPCGAPGCATNPSACPTCTCPRASDANNQLTWNIVSTQRSLNYYRKGLDILALLAFIVVFRTVGYLALKYMKYNRR